MPAMGVSREPAFIVAWMICITFSSRTLTEGAVLQEFTTPRQPPPPPPPPMTSQTLTAANPGSWSLSSLAELADLGARSGFRMGHDNGRKLAKGIRRVRLQQTYGGYDVFGASSEAEMDFRGNLTGHMYGEVVRDLDKDIPDPEACQRNVKRLQDLAIRLERLSPRDPDVKNRDARRIIYAGPERTKPRIAYRIEFLYANAESVKRPLYFFDACTGFVLLSYNQVRIRIDPSRFSKVKGSFTRSEMKFNASAGCSVSAEGIGGNEKIGQITYNTQPFCLNVQKSFNRCTMDATYSKVVDNEESRDENRQNAVSFSCSSGYSDAVNGAFGVANDALYYGETSGRFFEEKYDMRSLNWKPRLVVHYGQGYQNAFWDGTDMFFGDGAEILHPFVDIDTVAHELAHGVIQLHSDLVYRGMAGGINEAFADITGETTKHFLRNSNDWLISYDVIKRDAGFEALRYFADPTRDGRSIKHVLGYRLSMNVHFSSGVFNHAFYLMVEAEGMNIYEAYECFLDANLNLWKPFSNFFSGACNVMQAAYDNGYDHRKVRRAFWRVGVPLIFCRYSALTTSVMAGETRGEIRVSASRSPILRVDVDQKRSKTTSIRVSTGDNSKVHVVVAKDDEASKVIARGDNTVSFNNSFSHVYVQLLSKSSTDVKVTMETTM